MVFWVIAAFFIGVFAAVIAVCIAGGRSMRHVERADYQPWPSEIGLGGRR